ncbi:2-amino-4-hydroxy-6-hydroxymethyldihydropteridine diphosphokinase [Neptunomonas sp. XY-337]|uniref:2-amino-4-hydroxy-6- hydroxymethyldihydropteridine diphosphokinase n=1 Tax=Neptunomonas sp. XY-337 TaxID=2561897 RepID=UPI0010A9E92F|nr:2-amino-4-hydroxy-6-hydroxymethyldihydropteridine diphosphokinase [Neptunomonas sp. XY-337]
MTQETKHHKCYIGLGSNLDDPIAQVTRAFAELAQLPHCTLLAQSSIYRSDPVGPQDQPDFINAVALLETTLAPEQLLDALQAIEQQHRRIRKQHWGPRTLDLDIILFGDAVIDTERLQVPHPFATQRNFVLWPMAEINSELIFPPQRPISDLLVACPVGTLEKISV